MHERRTGLGARLVYLAHDIEHEAKESARAGFAFVAAGRPLRFCVTENGLGEAADANRAPYLVAHVEQILAAIRDGVDVFGYLYWSLMDNWEWLEHYRPASRHGLFSVDRRTPELRRYMTDAGEYALMQSLGWLPEGVVLCGASPSRRAA